MVVGEGGEQAGEFVALGRAEGGEEFVLRLADEGVQAFEAAPARMCAPPGRTRSR
ncbi:hypothetical protein ACF08A_11265 [Streptomyces cellulosae]